jgi:UDP-N-acetylmuramoylalanine--D-glutamate ligase
MDASWFVEITPEVKTVAVTGTRGKSTTTYLIYETLKSVEKTKTVKGKVYLGGNIRGLATLPYLKKVRAGDIMVLELDSWQLQGFGDEKISPNISVFTNLLSDHLNYYLKVSRDETEAVSRYFLDKANIFSSQKPSDFLILDKNIKKIIEGRFGLEKINSTIKTIGNRKHLENWKIKIKGEHNLDHILRAIEVAKIFGLDDKQIKKAIENFKGVPGRQELVRIYRGVKIYNDTNSTTPDAAVVALRSLCDDNKKNLILIAGGADKNLDMTSLVNEIPKYCKNVVFLSGTGTDKLLNNFPQLNKFVVCHDIKSAVNTALTLTSRGDSLVLSPAFASFGMFKNEYDRGDQFVALVKKFK